MHTDEEIQLDSLTLINQPMAVDSAPTEQPTPGSDLEKRVNDMISDMPLIARPDRARLRHAIDKVDAPPTGRAKSDQALGRITKWAKP